MKPSIFRHASAILLTLLLAACAAQERPPSAQMPQPQPSDLTVETDRIPAILPGPPWANGTPLEQASFVEAGSRESAGNRTFTFVDTIPSGETFETRTQMYSLAVESPADAGIDEWAQVVLSRFEENCDGVHAISSEATPPGTVLFAIACGKNLRVPAKGLFAIVAAQAAGRSIITAQHHFILDAYKYDPDHNPIGNDAFTASATALAQLRVGIK